MNTEHPSRPRPRLRPLRRIALAGAVVVVATLAWGLFGPDVPIRVSRETTFITDPLAADGLPDYRAAMLAAMGPPPKPEDNAMVELLQVMWPAGISEANLPVVCKALGVPAVAPADPLQKPAEQAAAEMSLVKYDPSRMRAWKRAEFPEIEAWLVAQATALDRLVAAADKPRCWLPWPALLGSECNVGQGEVPNVSFFCDVANKLCWRAMWHAGAGRHAAAWRDIRAVYRFSRRLADPNDLPPGAFAILYASQTGALADATLTHGLLGLPGLPAEVLAEIRRDLDALGPLPNLVDTFGGERLNSIDWIVLFYRMPGGRVARRQALEPSVVLVPVDAPPPSWFEKMYLSMDSAHELAARTSLDWSVTLKRVNAYYDVAESALRLPSHAARKAALGQLRNWGNGYMGSSKLGTAGHFVQGVSSREHRSAVFADAVLPELSGYFEICTRGQASFDLARTAAALAAWRADHSEGNEPYPETLDALIPRYLSAVPLDPFTEKPLVYERRGGGYVLASVGENGVYDGGDDRDGWIVGGEWQATEQKVDRQKSDLVVRMPVSALTPR